jgi:hypothetical protein
VRPPLFTTAALAAVAMVGLAACGNDTPDRSEGNYCAQVSQHLAELNKPTIATQADIEATLKVWQGIADAAPLAVQAEWATMVANVATAGSVDPNDPASVQKVADSARASQPSADRVIDYTYRKCKVLIGKVKPVNTTTTAPAASATAPPTKP